MPAAVMAQQAPTFRTGTTLLTVDVAVFDDDGKPVPGLEADAFEVTINGRRQPVKLVSYLQARGEQAPATAGRAPVRPTWDGRQGRQTVSNEGVVAPTTQAGEDRVFVVMFDDLSMTPTRGQRLAIAAQKFVASLPASDPVGVVRSSNALEALNPTLDRVLVERAIRRMSGVAGESVALRPQGSEEQTNPGADGYVGKAQALDIDEGMLEPLKLAIARACFNGDRAQVDSQVLEVLISNNECAGQVRMQARQTAALLKRQSQMQIDVVAAVLKAMGSADGIRHLVLVSDGLPVGRAADRLKPLARAAAVAGVQVSVLMEEPDMSLVDEGRRVVSGTATGLPVAPPQTDIGAAQRRIEDQRMEMDGLQTATEMMGGQFYRVVGDPMPFFERVRTASAAIYRLGIEPPQGLQVGREISVDAKVKRSGVSVFVNRHALVPAPAPPAAATIMTVEDRLKAAIAAGQQHGAIPLQTATLLRRAPGDASKVEVTINLEAGGGASPAKGQLTALYSLARAAAVEGEQLPSGRQSITPTAGGLYQSTIAIPATPGAYQLRVAVGDAEGAMGAVVTELDATLPVLGPFAASDLLVAWVDGQGRPQLMALEPIPATATGIRAELELYPPAAGVSLSTVQVELSLTKSGESDPLDERIVTPSDVRGAWRVATEFPADGLTPGRYLLRAKVLVGDAVVGTSIATLTRK